MKQEPKTSADPAKPDDAADEGYDAWVKAEIEATLAKKANGQMRYRSLDEVMAKFGFNAR